MSVTAAVHVVLRVRAAFGVHVNTMAADVMVTGAWASAAVAVTLLRLQLSAVITRSNIVTYYINNYRN